MIEYILEIEASNRAQAEKEALEILQLGEDDVEFETSNSNAIKRLFKSSPSFLRVKCNPKKQIPQENIARGIIFTILQKMNLPAKVEGIEAQGDSIYISLATEESSCLIGKHGRSLDSLQFMVNMLVNKRYSGSKLKKIVIDISGYRKRRKKIIEELCEKVSEKVIKSGRVQTLNTMSPYERRLVHITLEANPEIYTESLGDGVYKRVRVYPKKKSRSQAGHDIDDDTEFNRIHENEESDMDEDFNIKSENDASEEADENFNR